MEKSLVELLSVMENHMIDNFYATVLVLGGLGVAIHYEQLKKQSDRGVPLVMADGQPVSGKSTAVSIAMSIIGQRISIGGKYGTVLKRES